MNIMDIDINNRNYKLLAFVTCNSSQEYSIQMNFETICELVFSSIIGGSIAFTCMISKTMLAPSHQHDNKHLHHSSPHQIHRGLILFNH
jgi:hypothetical protein